MSLFFQSTEVSLIGGTALILTELFFFFSGGCSAGEGGGVSIPEEIVEVEVDRVGVALSRLTKRSMFQKNVSLSQRKIKTSDEEEGEKMKMWSLNEVGEKVERTKLPLD